MFTWNFQYISKARLSSTLKQLNLSANQGDILIRIHTAIHSSEEAVELARFIKNLVPKAFIFGTSCSAVINRGRYSLNQCVISVTTFEESSIRCEMIPLFDEYSGTPLPVDMLCGQIRKEIVTDNTRLLMTFFSGQFKDAYHFVERCNDFFPTVPMTGGVVSLPLTSGKKSETRGFVFNDDGFSDRAMIIASFSGKELENMTSFATGVQAIGEEVEITDSFKSCILSIDGKDAVDVYQMGLDHALYDHPELLHLFPYVYTDSESVPILLNYVQDGCIAELFPAADPENEKEYAMRPDLDVKVRGEKILANHNVKIGKKLKRAFIYDGKIVADNRSLFQKIENFEKAETLFAYSSMARSSIYSDCVKWELYPYENTNMCGCITEGEIVYADGKNAFGHGAFVVSAIGEKPYSQEYNPYAFSRSEALARENPRILNHLMDTEERLTAGKDQKDIDNLLAFVRDCEKKILYSESEEIPNEAALYLDVKAKEHDRVCVINITERAEMESVFPERQIDMTYKNYLSTCMNFAKAKKYHLYMINEWQIAFAEPSYRVSLSQFVEDMSALQKELFEFKEELIAIVPIFCVIDGCTADNLRSMYYSSYVEMMNKNIQFFVCDAAEEVNIDEDAIRERYHMVNVIHYAITHNKVVPYFQGIYDNEKKTIHHYESLMRILDENGRIYYPNSFLDIARSYGVFYDEMSKIMIRKVFERFRDETERSVSINIGLRDILNKEVLELIYDCLSQAKHPENFTFEILENEEIEDYNVLVAFADRVHELGGKIAIDDFGSGFSNLQHILSIHSDFIKIDGSIIRKCCVNKDSENIIALITGWKKLSSHQISIVAEYVENQDIQDKLVSYGVDFSQGYLFSKPASELLDLPETKE
ncbi:MAG: EAL domain-containing protein [Clostridiales bacterium]|nr:EAL domain-containing protein [Clostridiales bacterium]